MLDLMPPAPFADRAGADAFLRGLARSGGAPLPLAEAALAFACRDRPEVDLARYHAHLAALAREVGEEAGSGSDLHVRSDALAAVLAGRYGYAGDTLTYEDLQNANLMRVIDRKKGLPVALGILYIHAGRTQGWDMAGLAFPGHFLIRIEGQGERRILDPFAGGAARAPGELRDLLRRIAGGTAELERAHYAAVSDRDVLLRLQNNIKLRLVGARRLDAALTVIDGMLLLAPDQAPLWREAGIVQAELGRIGAAVAALEQFLTFTESDAERHQVALLLQKLRTQLQ
jgi:regulator of sirC expression with transglutaminase-like and TPR domain